MYRILYCAGVIIGLFISYPSIAKIEGSCFMCHKYPGLGRIESNKADNTNEIKRVFYINSELYSKTYHGAIRCRSCHTAVTKIPHNGAKEVDCSTNCHIIDPSSNKQFSHKKIVTDFNASVHGKNGSDTFYQEDLPICKDCHSNKAYHAEYEKHQEGMTFLKVCEECHQSGDFTKRYYEHISYRTSKRRSSKEVVKLCSTCHNDKTLMDRHELDVVAGFSNTFHAKALFYGNTQVPNCLNCHAPYTLGFSPHRITSKKNSDSPTNPENKHLTCSQSGCHVNAEKSFASGGYVHPSPEKIESSRVFGSQKITRQQNIIIDWIQTFYKILIALVIGGLAFHRILDFHATQRENNKGRHSE